MATRFYFHAASSGVSGTLPTTEQSALTAAANADAQTVNRSMDTSIGTAVASLNIPSASGTRDLYYTKFVSPLIYQSSIAANTWVYAFGAMEASNSINFPVSGTNKSVYVNIYVWKPSTGTKVGTILDGNTAATVDESSANTQCFHIVNATGAAVNGLTSGDAVIIIEIWFQITTAVVGAETFYYDGTTVYAENGTASPLNAASYLETPETINLTASNNVTKTLTETIAISEPNPPAILKTHNVIESVPAQTITISESAFTIQRTKQRTPASAESITVTTGTIADRLSTKARSISTQSVSLSDQIERLDQKQRTITGTETIATSDLAEQLKGTSGPKEVDKSLTEPAITISDLYSRISAKQRKIGFPI